MSMMTRHRSATGSSTVGFLVGVAVALLAVAAGAWMFRAAFWGPPRIDTSRPTVVRQIRQLERLETVVFGMDKIVSGGWESPYLPKFMAGERLLLVVYGEVTAGIDLSRIDATDVVVSGRTIRMKISAPEVFGARVDNDRTRV